MVLASDIMSSGDVVVTLEEEAEQFAKAMEIVEDIIENTYKYTGRHATNAGLKLAAIRTKILQYAQYYKSSSKSPTQRLRKDLLHAMATGLEENINTLKLAAKHDLELTKGSF